MGLVLDSSVVIAAERRGDNVTQMLKQIVAATGDQRAVLTSVGLTELVHGIYRAQTAQARSRRDSFIRELLNDLEVYAYTKETALLAGKIDGEQRSRGIIIPFGDLLIGATALEVGYSMLTVNVRHFRLIPGLTVIQL
ncbi:MAG TPA: PIN domain-containing protein [Candidatus Bathyarchaeia archaeon]|nr:PIN domain-containing protein [Candidatus Bathyarchaeia archaeon]